MVTDYIAARDVLKSRLEAVFDPATFAILYSDDLRAPEVFLGFPASEPPFYAAVDEIVSASSTSGGVSMGHAQVEYTLHVWLHAQHSRLETAANALLSYIDAVFGSIMADPQLNFTVENALPSIESAGTAADSSKRYIAAASIAVACTIYSACPASLKAVVDADNQRLREEGSDEGNGNL